MLDDSKPKRACPTRNWLIFYSHSLCLLLFLPSLCTKECLFLPCRHMALCSNCTSSYFARTREWNLLAAQVRADATTEANQSAARGLSTSGSISVRNKHADRANTCPSCSQTVALAIRRAPSESGAACTVVDVVHEQ